jgi:hypothetical protein
MSGAELCAWTMPAIACLIGAGNNGELMRRRKSARLADHLVVTEIANDGVELMPGISQLEGLLLTLRQTAIRGASLSLAWAARSRPIPGLKN